MFPHRWNVLAVVALALALPPALRSQDNVHTILDLGRVHLTGQTPNCNPFTRAHDAVWLHGVGWTMPRVGWHIMYPAVNYGIAKGLTKIGVNPKVAAIGASLGMGLIPHTRQAVLGLRRYEYYEANVADWVFDLWNRSLPTVELAAKARNSKAPYLVWAAGDALLMCYARP